MKTRVAFQGEVGAYSEDAAFQFFGNKITTISCKSLKEVFQKVKSGDANFGVVPVENSLEGTIGQTYDLLFLSNLKIKGETILRIIHCLITLPGTEMKSLKTIYSHPQALGQCRQFLEKLKCDLVPTYDTAGSVKMLKEKNLKGSAAIASERAAKVYGMEILAKGIETNKNNFTRFFIISTTDSRYTGKDKTSLMFSTKHVPGALFKCLEGFAARKINLTKIESRPVIGKPWEYNFFLDFEGHRNEKKVKEAIKVLKKNSTFVKILGSYPKWS